MGRSVPHPPKAPGALTAASEASVQLPAPLPGPEGPPSAVGQLVVGHRGNPLVGVRESGLVFCAVETDWPSGARPAGPRPRRVRRVTRLPFSDRKSDQVTVAAATSRAAVSCPQLRSLRMRRRTAVGRPGLRNRRHAGGATRRPPWKPPSHGRFSSVTVSRAADPAGPERLAIHQQVQGVRLGVSPGRELPRHVAGSNRKVASSRVIAEVGARHVKANARRSHTGAVVSEGDLNSGGKRY